MGYIPDISHWHPCKSFAQLKANCDFAISKATQGTNNIDSTLYSFIAGCESVGLPYWLYTYLNKGNERKQADYMVKICSNRVGKYFVGYVLDVEAGNAAADVKLALDYLKTTGPTMIYTMYAQYNTYKSVIQERPDNCAWWEARYGSNNGTYNSKYPAHSGCDLHQYTSAGYCPGVGSGVDLNRICGKKTLEYFTGYDGEPAADGTGVDDMQCTFQIDKKNPVYWYDGFEIRSLYNLDQLKIIQRIFKAANGRNLPHYNWTSKAPWFMRLQQAIDAGAVRFEKQPDDRWIAVKK